MCFLELMATPEASPRYMSAGSFRRLATESKGISGTPEFRSAANDAAQKQVSAIGRNGFTMVSSGTSKKYSTVRYQTPELDATGAATNSYLRSSVAQYLAREKRISPKPNLATDKHR